MTDQNPKNQEIRQMLIRLHDELREAETLDENEQALLRHLIDDIQDLLKRAEHGSSSRYQPNTGLIGQMETAIEELEVSHPTLVATIRKALDILNVAGI